MQHARPGTAANGGGFRVFYSLRHGLGQHYLGSAALAHNQHPSFKSFSLPCKRRGLLPRRKLMLSCYIFFRLYLIGHIFLVRCVISGRKRATSSGCWRSTTCGPPASRSGRIFFSVPSFITIRRICAYGGSPYIRSSGSLEE